MTEPKLNPETGKKDGIYYTLGGSSAALTLNSILALSKKLGKVKTIIDKYRRGLTAISEIRDDEIKKTLLKDWRCKYSNVAKELLTVEEGQTYLLNMIVAEYRQIAED